MRRRFNNANRNLYLQFVSGTPNVILGRRCSNAFRCGITDIFSGRLVGVLCQFRDDYLHLFAQGAKFPWECPVNLAQPFAFKLATPRMNWRLLV